MTKHFTVVTRLQGAARMPNGPRLHLEWADGRSATVMAFETDEGHVSPIHRGLHIRVDGPADSLTAARDEFPAVAGGVARLVGLAANAFAGHPLVLSAYECTPGLSRRDIYLAALPMPVDMPLQSRSIPVEETGILFQRLMAHEAVGARLGRAIGHYYRALEDWHPATRLQFAVSAYVAVEALTPLLKEKELQGGVTAENLARSFGIDPESSNWRNQLDGTLRLRYIFHGDDKTYRDSKNVSDGFEHSFMAFGKGRVLATHDLCLSLARHIRHAIFEAIDLPADVVSSLSSDKRDAPVESYPPTSGLHGELAMPDGASFETHEGPYPWLEYHPKLVGAERLENRVNYTITRDMTAHDVPLGAELSLARQEVRGPTGMDVPGFMNATADGTE